MRCNPADERTERVCPMYDYYIEQLKTDLDEAQTAWKEVKAQLEDTYMLVTSKTCRARITRALGKVENWFKKVKPLTTSLSKDEQSSSVELLAKIEKELGLEYLKTFSFVCDTVFGLPASKDQKESIMEGVRHINDRITDMKGTLRFLVD